MSRECDGEEDGKEADSSPQKGPQGKGDSSSEPSAPSFYPSWKRTSSDTEVSDSEGNAQSKLRHVGFRLKLLPPLLAWQQNEKAQCVCACLCILISSLPPLQDQPWPCSPGGAELSPGSGQRCGEEDSVRILVLLHPRLSRQPAGRSVSAHNRPEGPLAEGEVIPARSWA